MTRKLSEFLNEELVDYASYDNLRKIASVMDGLKNSGRKVISTVLDLNVKDNSKVLQLSNRQAEHCVTGDTLVKTSEGLKPIQELLGKEVLVECLDYDGNKVLREAIHIRETKETTEIIEIQAGSSLLRCTPEHKILTNRGWLEAKDVMDVDFIRRTEDKYFGGEYASIHNIKRITLEEPIKVYDLEVPDFHNFGIGEDGLVIHNCEYLHGSLDGVVVNLAKDYSGTNNLPLLQKKGNFGTRFANEASAPRYIFTRKTDYLDDLFVKEDSFIVPEQHFEGTKIEPMFFVPTLPLLLINGSNGISSGFAQLILNRSVKDIKDYLVKTLEGKKPKKFPLPSFNDFEGVVKKGEKHGQFIIQGKVTRKSPNRVLIEEVPYQYDLKGYISVLDKLEEDKKIQSYKDLSNDKFCFEVQIPSKELKMLSDDELLNFLKLSRAVSENYTSLTHENKIKEYENPEDIMSDYIKVKLEYTQKRKDYILKGLEDRINQLESRFKFIQAVVNDELILAKRKKAQIIEDIDSLGVLKEGTGVTRYDYLLRLPVSSLTSEELSRLEKNIKDAQKEIKELKAKTPTEIWLEDISKLKV